MIIFPNLIVLMINYGVLATVRILAAELRTGRKELVGSSMKLSQLGDRLGV